MWKPKERTEDKQFHSRVRIISSYVMLVIAVTLILTFVIYRFPEVKTILSNLIKPLRPVIYGVVIAYLLNPICNWLRDMFEQLFANVKHGKKIANILAIGLSVVFGVGAVIALVWLIIPGLISSVTQLISDMPGYVTSLQTWITETEVSDALKENLSDIVERVSEAVENWVQTDLASTISSLVSKVTTGVIDVVKFVINFFVGVVIAIYLLRDKKSAISQMKKVISAVFSDDTTETIIETARQGHKIFGGFLYGKLLDSLIIGIICFVGMSLLKMPYTLLVSVIVGVTNIIPVFGPFLGAIPSALLILMVNPLQCLYFLIFILILQQLDGNVIGPRILGTSIGINEFWITFSLLLFGGIFGFFGMVIGVPLFALIYFLTVKAMNRQLEAKGLPVETFEYEHITNPKELKGGKTMDFFGMETYELRAGGYHAWVLPQIGGQLMGLEKDGIKALHEPTSKDDLGHGSTSYGLPILFPPNRIDGGTFEADGHVYKFPLNEAARGNSLHGFLHTRPWKVEAASKNEIRMSFTGDETTDFYLYYPVNFKVEMTYRLSEKGLVQTVTVKNNSDFAMPLGLGFHSAFNCEEDTKVRLSVGRRIEVNDRMLPTGVVRRLNEQEELLRTEGLSPVAWSMDDHYTAEPLVVDGRTFHGAILDRHDAVVRYTVDDFYKHWMVWNKNMNGQFICLEPQNWRINAPNLVREIGVDAGCTMLPAGQEISVTAKIEIEPKNPA